MPKWRAGRGWWRSRSLHGFGFAGALADIGLPQGDIPLALFTFNLGVELGQLIFIAGVLAVLACAKRIRLSPLVERHASAVTPYAIGIVAAFWFVERLAGFTASLAKNSHG